MDCSLRQQFILHDALDIFDEISGPPPGFAWRGQRNVTGTEAMWAGCLCPIEDMRVYGYMTTTQIKLLITILDDPMSSDQRAEDQNVKNLAIKLHGLYVEYILNPFSPINGPILSRSFDAKVDSCVRAHNKSLS